MKWLFRNIHTILLLGGLGLISYSAFLLGDIIGYFVSGLLLVLLAIVINKSNS